MKRLTVWQTGCVVLALSVVACNGGKNQTNIELVQNMMDQVSVKSQDWDPTQGDKLQMRAPPEHTIPRNFKPYRFRGDPIGAEKNLKNPLAGQMSPEVLSMGKKYYEIYCSVCHGAAGAGDGTVAPKMALKPPPLTSDKVIGFQDGRIFHIITDGQGVMGTYATQITDEKTRWAIVNYVRSLQRKNGG